VILHNLQIMLENHSLCILTNFVTGACKHYGLETDHYVFWNQYWYFQNFFHWYLVSCRYSIGHRHRYSEICLPIYFPICFQSIL